MTSNTNLSAVTTSLTNIINNSISKCVIQSKQSQNMNFECTYSKQDQIDFKNSTACLLTMKAYLNDPTNALLKSTSDYNCNPCFVSGNSQQMKMTIKGDCQVENDITNNIHDSIKNDIKQKVENKHDDLLFGLGSIFGSSGDKTQTEVINTLTKAITSSSISEALSESSQIQIMTSRDSQTINNSQKMVGDIVFKSLMKNKQINDAVTAVVNLADQTVKNETTNPLSTAVTAVSGVIGKIIDLPKDLLGGLTQLAYPIIAIIALFVIYKVLSLFGGRRNDDNDDNYDNRYNNNKYNQDSIDNNPVINLNKKNKFERLKKYIPIRKSQKILPVTNSRLDSV